MCVREGGGGKLDQGVGALKGGRWNPLANYAFIKLDQQTIKKRNITLAYKTPLTNEAL